MSRQCRLAPLNELFTCIIYREKLYEQSVPESKMLELYGKWGGRPRYVLEKANEESSQMELEAMIGSCIPGDVLKSFGEHRGEETASDRWVLINHYLLVLLTYNVMRQVAGNSR